MTEKAGNLLRVLVILLLVYAFLTKSRWAAWAALAIVAAGILVGTGWRFVCKGGGMLLAYFGVIVFICLPYALLSLLNYRLFDGSAWPLPVVGALITTAVDLDSPPLRKIVWPH